MQSLETEEKLIYTGYAPFQTLTTAAWEFDSSTGSKTSGVLDFYRFDKKNPLKIGLDRTYLELSHLHGTHLVPLEMFFSGSVLTFGHQAEAYYKGNPCLEKQLK